MVAYDKYVICLDKTPDEFHATLLSLMQKAIKAYNSRAPLLRHGIALDKHVTIILSQNDNPRPLCGIYFNLHTPYQKPQYACKTVEEVPEKIGESKSRSEAELAPDRYLSRTSSPGSESPATISARIFSSFCGPVIFTSPTFNPRR